MIDDMKALYEIKYPKIKDATDEQLAADKTMENRLNGNFRTIDTKLIEHMDAINDLISRIEALEGA